MPESLDERCERYRIERNAAEQERDANQERCERYRKEHDLARRERDANDKRYTSCQQSVAQRRNPNWERRCKQHESKLLDLNGQVRDLEQQSLIAQEQLTQLQRVKPSGAVRRLPGEPCTTVKESVIEFQDRVLESSRKQLIAKDMRVQALTVELKRLRQEQGVRPVEQLFTGVYVQTEGLQEAWELALCKLELSESKPRCQITDLQHLRALELMELEFLDSEVVLRRGLQQKEAMIRRGFEEESALALGQVRRVRRVKGGRRHRRGRLTVS